MVLTTSQIVAPSSSSSDAKQLTVKLATSSGHFRRFQIAHTLTLEQFKAKYAEQPQEEGAEPRQSKLVFLDDEKDWCSITTEEEWVEAKKLFAEQGILKLKIEESAEAGCPWSRGWGRGCRRMRGGAANGEFKGRKCRGFFLKKLLCIGALAIVCCKFLGGCCFLPLALIAFFGFRMLKRAHCRRMEGQQARKQCNWAECIKKVCESFCQNRGQCSWSECIKKACESFCQARCPQQAQAQQPEAVPAPAQAPAAEHQESASRLYPETAPSAPVEKIAEPATTTSTGKHQYHDSLYALEQMGFGNNLLNMHLLKHHKGELTAVIGDLIKIQGIEKTYTQ